MWVKARAARFNQANPKNKKRLPVGMRGSLKRFHVPAQNLSPAFPEWMMGLPLGHVTGVPGLNRNQQLKAIGNGVCPQQALAAITNMLQTLDVPVSVD